MSSGRDGDGANDGDADDGGARATAGTSPRASPPGGADGGSRAGGGDGDHGGTGADGGDRDHPLYAIGVCLGAGLLGFLATQLWGAVILGAVYGTAELTDLQRVLVSLPAGGLGMATGAVLYLRIADRPVSFLDLELPDLRDVAYVLGGIVALLVALQAIVFAFSQFQVSTAEHGTADAIRGADADVVAYLVVASLVFVGPGEELLFRNVVQKRLYGAFSRRGAIVVASVIFAAVHFYAYATGSLSAILASLAIVFALSLLLGWIYHRTDSVVVPALVHGVYNAVQFVSLSVVW